MYLLILSHGHLASGIITSFEMIAGKNSHLDYIELDDAGVGDFRKKLSNYLENKEQILILADIKGGTPYNEALKQFLKRPNQIQLVSGLNLSMLLEIGTQLDNATNATELAKTAEKVGKKSIEIATDEEDNVSDEIEF